MTESSLIERCIDLGFHRALDPSRAFLFGFLSGFVVNALNAGLLILRTPQQFKIVWGPRTVTIIVLGVLTSFFGGVVTSQASPSTGFIALWEGVSLPALFFAARTEWQFWHLEQSTTPPTSG